MRRKEGEVPRSGSVMANSPDAGQERQVCHLPWQGSARRSNTGGEAGSVVDVDAPAVSAEVGADDLAEQDDVVPEARPDGPPHDGLHLRLVVVAQLGAEAVVQGRRRRGRGGEVAAVGGAVEEQVRAVVVVESLSVAVVAVVDVHRPRRVHGGPDLAEGDALPVGGGVEVGALHAAPQPHVVPVLEAVHRSPALESRGGGFLVSWRCGEAEKRRSESCWLRRLCWAPRQSIYSRLGFRH